MRNGNISASEFEGPPVVFLERADEGPAVVLAPSEVGGFIEYSGSDDVVRGGKRWEKTVPCGYLFGGNHVHEKDGMGRNRRRRRCVENGGRVVKVAVLLRMSYGVRVDVVAIDRFCAKGCCCKREDAASAADVKDGLFGDVRGHESECKTGRGMREIAEARSGKKLKRF